MKVNRQNFPVVLVITLCKVALTFASVHEIAVHSTQSRELGVEWKTECRFDLI